MKLKDRIKTYNFWVSLSSAIFLIIKLLGQQFNFNVDESLFSDIITSLCGILVILGIIAPPTNKSVGAYQENLDESNKITDETCKAEQTNNSNFETQITDDKNINTIIIKPIEQIFEQISDDLNMHKTSQNDECTNENDMPELNTIETSQTIDIIETQNNSNDNNVKQEMLNLNTNQIAEEVQAENDEHKLLETQSGVTEQIVQKSETESDEIIIAEKNYDRVTEQVNNKTEESQPNSNDNVKSFLSDVLKNNNLDDVAKLEIINSLKSELENLNN